MFFLQNDYPIAYGTVVDFDSMTHYLVIIYWTKESVLLRCIVGLMQARNYYTQADTIFLFSPFAAINTEQVSSWNNTIVSKCALSTTQLWSVISLM